VIVVILLLRRYKISSVYSLLIFFNIAFLYDSYLWGQLDIFVDFFVLFALYFALVKKPTASAIAFLMALNCKPQAFPFLPFFLILIGLQIPNIKRLFRLILILFITQVVLILPFVIFGQGASLLNVFASTTGYFPIVSINAFNFWVLVFVRQYAGDISDLATFMGISYRIWGLALFGLSSLLVLIPVFKNTLRLRKEHFSFKLRDVSFYALSVCMIAFSFFMFTTQMHERYLDAAIVFAGVYAITSKRYLFYGLISFVYFLNINELLGHFELQKLIPIFVSAHSIAAMMMFVFVVGFYEFGRFLAKTR
jgi:Gpi18-like mannosyltransferase